MSEKKPIKKFRAGLITATIWENEITVKEELQKVKSIVIERSYKDDKDEWRTTTSYNVNDLPKVELVTKQAYAYCTLKDE